jgi:hypothetical protein
MRKKITDSIIAFIGLMLSPITWWNDPFVNIPLSYVLATAISHFYPKIFFISFIITYWFTNIIGILMFYSGSKGLLNTVPVNKWKQILTIFVYTAIIIMLSFSGMIKPFTLK